MKRNCNFRVQFSRGMGLFLALICVLLLLPNFSACVPQDGALVISEVCTSNKGSLVDEVYGSPDWIELYNGT
ncbi:MAG: hypothetical protein FWF10_07035, partial [Clostridiales bacterium]|nr:hypothetical protein [Clostridiales bacterium]